VFQQKLIALALALVVSLGLSSPTLALGADALATPTPSPVAPPADAAEAPAEVSSADGDAAPEQPQKRKGNGFARALSAPFRALARLFGGGKKNDAAKKREQPAPAPKTETAAADKPEPAEPAVVAQEPAAAPAPLQSALKEAPAVRAAEGPRVVRPAEAGAARPNSGMWIPVIEGISKDPLSQGRALLEHGYVQESISELSIAATQAGPGLIEANNLLGIAYDRMGWHRQAIEAYNRALTFAPKDAFVLANLGFSLYLADDHQNALKRLKQASKLAPGNPVIYNNLGTVLARLRKYDEAYKHFAIASNDYDAHLKLAGILEDQRRDSEAAKHYEAALRMQPGASAVLERLVALYDRTGQRDKADMARRALGRPKNPQRTTTGGGGGGD
jgi:Flp pilus assembly protein TadD